MAELPTLLAATGHSPALKINEIAACLQPVPIDTVEDYERGLREAGFAHVQVVDSGSDLNAYARVENQSGCCSPAMETAPAEPVKRGLPIATSDECCAPAPEPLKDANLHERLAELLRIYNVNDYAASVRVYALKAE